MSVRKRTNRSTKKGNTESIKSQLKATKTLPKEEKNIETKNDLRKESIDIHLPPLFLVTSILLCSGFMWMLAFRDMMATGKPLLGSIDEDYLVFTGSTDWFNESHGWKSTAGGLSAVQPVTTDANKMGHFFVRKLGGAAALGFQTQKLLPFLSHSDDARWAYGHFSPLLFISILGNMAVIAFFASYLADLKRAETDRFAMIIMSVLSIEAVIMFFYLVTNPNKKGTKIIKDNMSKSKSAIPSRIVMRTVILISGLITIIAGRDLFFSGQIIAHIPRDDIYLEWTGAFIHSPPEGSPEENEYSMEAPLHFGDKFMSQLTALYMLISCLYKFSTAFFIRYGEDGSGVVKCRLIWKAQCITGCLVVCIFRVFASASLSASLDFRWHLMCLSYETFILGLCGYW